MAASGEPAGLRTVMDDALSFVIGPFTQIVLFAHVADLFGVDRPIRLRTPFWQRYCTCRPRRVATE